MNHKESLDHVAATGWASSTHIAEGGIREYLEARADCQTRYQSTPHECGFEAAERLLADFKTKPVTEG